MSATASTPAHDLHALELFERWAQRHAAAADLVLANGILVRAGPLLHDRDGAADPAERFEIAQQDHGVG